jgi:hypothetical protein
MMSPTAEHIHDATGTFTERTAALRRQMHVDQAQTARLDAVEDRITTMYRTRWHQLGGMAAFFLCFSRVL